MCVGVCAHHNLLLISFDDVLASLNLAVRQVASVALGAKDVFLRRSTSSHFQSHSFKGQMSKR